MVFVEVHTRHAAELLQHLKELNYPEKLPHPENLDNEFKSKNGVATTLLSLAEETVNRERQLQNIGALDDLTSIVSIINEINSPMPLEEIDSEDVRQIQELENSINFYQYNSRKHGIFFLKINRNLNAGLVKSNSVLKKQSNDCKKQSQQRRNQVGRSLDKLMADAFDFLKSLDDLSVLVNDAFFSSTDFCSMGGLAEQSNLLEKLDEYVRTQILTGIAVKDFDEELQVVNLDTPTDSEQILSDYSDARTSFLRGKITGLLEKLNLTDVDPQFFALRINLIRQEFISQELTRVLNDSERFLSLWSILFLSFLQFQSGMRKLQDILSVFLGDVRALVMIEFSPEIKDAEIPACNVAMNHKENPLMRVQSRCEEAKKNAVTLNETFKQFKSMLNELEFSKNQSTLMVQINSCSGLVQECQQAASLPKDLSEYLFHLHRMASLI